MTVYTDLRSYVCGHTSVFFRKDLMHLIAARSDLEPAGIRTHALAINQKCRLRSDRAANSAFGTHVGGPNQMAAILSTIGK